MSAISLMTFPSCCGGEICLVPATGALQNPFILLKSFKLLSGSACSGLGLIQASGMKREILPTEHHAPSSKREISDPGVRPCSGTWWPATTASVAA